MNQEDRLQILRIIEEEQRGTDAALSGTAKAQVMIGGTTEEGQVEHDSLYITQAPDAILQALRDAGFRISLQDGVAEVEPKVDGGDEDEQ